MALLLVLFIVAMMAAIAVETNQYWLRSYQGIEKRTARRQAKWGMLGAEQLIRQQLTLAKKQYPGVTSLHQFWASPDQRIVLEGQTFIANVKDENACFNLNSLANKDPKQEGVAQEAQVFRWWLINMQIDEHRAEAITAAIRDWIDSDNESRPQGAENDFYLTLTPPRLAANRLLTDVSELRGVAGVDAELFRRLRPFICVLPQKRLQINLNTLRPEDAPLLSAVLHNQIDVADARKLLQSRPARGWESVAAFFASDLLKQKQDEQKKMQMNTTLLQGQTMLTVDSQNFSSRVYESGHPSYRLISHYQRNRNGTLVVQRQYGFTP